LDDKKNIITGKLGTTLFDDTMLFRKQIDLV